MKMKMKGLSYNMLELLPDIMSPIAKESLSGETPFVDPGSTVFKPSKPKRRYYRDNENINPSSSAVGSQSPTVKNNSSKNISQEELEDEEDIEDVESNTKRNKRKRRSVFNNNEFATNNFTYNNNDLSSRIAGPESGKDGYKAVSKTSTARGKYQFIWSLHNPDIKKVTGVKSEEDFLNNPEAQEKYFEHWDKNTLSPYTRKYGKELKKAFPGIDEVDIKRAIHFAGPKNIEKAIKNQSWDEPLDANGVSIRKYLNMGRRKYQNGTGEEGAGYGHFGQMIASLAPLVDSLVTGVPDYSTEPIVSSVQNSLPNPYTRKSFALGGTVPIEAEGGEMLETPLGAVGEIQGATHEQGGVNMNVPEGTKIYSDRLAIDNETMAKRKQKREKLMAKLQKQFDKQPNNPLLKKTLSRVMANNALEEQADLKMQEIAQSIYGQPGQFALGTGIGGTVYKAYNNYQKGLLSPIDADNFFDPNTITPPSQVNIDMGGVSNSLENSMNAIAKENRSSNPSQMTTGDYIGMASQLMAGIMPLINTMSNRAGDTPNINPYKNFGKRGLETMESSYKDLNLLSAKQMEDLRISRNTAKLAAQNSASSVNTNRALNFAIDQGFSNNALGINSKLAGARIGLNQAVAAQQNIMDQYSMSGEYQRDIADRQDRDVYNSNINSDFQTLFTQLQSLSKNLNTAKGRKDFLDFLPQLNKYGLTAVQENGEWKIIKQ